MSLSILACSPGGEETGVKTESRAVPAEHMVPPPEALAAEEGVSLTVKKGKTSDSSRAENTSPRVVSVALDPPDRVYRGVDIKALPKAEDPDSDVVSFRYQWVINGEEPLSADGPVLTGDRFKRGDRVSVKVTPYDREGAGETFDPIPIEIPNGPPKFVSTPQTEFRSAAYSYQVTATDPDEDPVTFSLASAPLGMSIDAQTGRIDWKITKNDGGEHTIEVVAEDSFGAKASQKYTLSVTVP